MDAETAEFFAGPHDGRLLTMQEIGRHCQLLKVTNQDEERLFVLMPSILEWNRVVDGKLPKAGPFDVIYAYELLQTAKGPALLLRGADEFSRAGGDLEVN